MKLRATLLVVVLIQLAVVLFVVRKATDEPWRGHQLAYNEAAMGSASTTATREALAAGGLEIRQDILTGFGEMTRVDRCRTCHAAIDDPRFADAAQPLKTHPKIPRHPFAEFGCTICHEGNGRALTAADAHGQDPHWTEPLLKGPYLEASCARCHPEPYLDEMPHMRRGRELFDRYACSGCHTVRGKSRGKLGPELSDVGNRFGLPYLHESIVEPRANSPMSAMPRFRMPEEDRVALVTFLKSLRGRTLVEDPITVRVETMRWKEQRPEEVPVTVEAGKEAVRKRACAACHRLEGSDGSLAPDLRFVGKIRDAAYIAEHLADPRKHTPGSNMPSFWMSSSERSAIATYLVTLVDVTVPATPAEQYRTLCARCHGDGGRGDGITSENLLPRPRDFGNSRYFNWLPRERALAAIANGVPGTAMPPFGRVLGTAQVEALFDHIRAAFVGPLPASQPGPRKLAIANPRPFTPESVASGKAVFQQRCYGCHGRLGNGKGPNAPDMVPRPRDLTSAHYLAKLADARLFESITYGVVGTGMPPWDYLPESQRWDLVNFVRSISRTGPNAGGVK